MVWQENCRVIVMTTKEMERGKVNFVANAQKQKIIIVFSSFSFQNKCARYWPEEGQTKEYGKSSVKYLVETSTADYTLREFLLSMEGSPSERKVYHYHFQVKTNTKSNEFILSKEETQH